MEINKKQSMQGSLMLANKKPHNMYQPTLWSWLVNLYIQYPPWTHADIASTLPSFAALPLLLWFFHLLRQETMQGIAKDRELTIFFFLFSFCWICDLLWFQQVWHLRNGPKEGLSNTKVQFLNSRSKYFIATVTLTSSTADLKQS